MVKKKEDINEPKKEAVIKVDTKKDELIALLDGNVRGLNRVSIEDVQCILDYLKSL